MSTQLTIDFRAVSHARLWYVNQWGEGIKTKPRTPTVHCQKIPSEIAAIWPDKPAESMLDRARRLYLLDRWTTQCSLQLRNNRSLQFVGNKAKEMYKAYSAHIYERKSKG